jgi:hypothetical protein
MNYIERFRTSIMERTSGRVSTRAIVVNDGANYASKMRSSEGEMQALVARCLVNVASLANAPVHRKTSWFDCVAIFSRLLSRSPKARGMDRVKIAIIDDGVDASLEILDGKIASGKSFCTYPQSPDLTSPYFISTSRHGTYMAAVICRICPNASLYVAKLDQRSDDGSEKQQVTARSATTVRFRPLYTANAAQGYSS